MSTATQDIVASLQRILDFRHTNSEKRKVRLYPSYGIPDRIAMACPVCLDSEKTDSKKRGNLYLKNFRYKCFNCGENMTYIGLMKMFDQPISPELRMEIVNNLDTYQQKVRWDEEESITNNLSKLIPIDELATYFNTDPASFLKEFKPVQKGSKVYQYLTEVRQIHDLSDIYEAKYYRNPKWWEPVLVNINQAKGKVLGIQLRNIRSEKAMRFFKIITFSELYEMVKKEELDEIEAYGYDKLSMLYNILKVDWGRPITVFEGYLDTKFLPNSIGCVGTNTDVGFLLNQGADLRFFYDADVPGSKKSKEHIKLRHTVFLWEKFLSDWSKKSSNPHSAYRKLKAHITDLNDVAKLIPNPYQELELENYFSIDAMDICWIPVVPDFKKPYTKTFNKKGVS